MNLCSPKEIKELMQAFGIRPSRALGQNFLIDSRVVVRTAELCCEGRSESILEIGPGVGCLTERLPGRYKNVVAIEIDSRLIPVLRFTLGNRSNIKIINADVLKCNLREITAPYLDGGLSVCANLPYYITTPILMLLLESGIPFDYITVMVQAEVAARLCASPGRRNTAPSLHHLPTSVMPSASFQCRRTPFGRRQRSTRRSCASGSTRISPFWRLMKKSSRG